MTVDPADVPDGRHEGRRRTVRRTWRTDPLTAYRLVSDVVATAVHSAEVCEIAWQHRIEPGLPSVGDRFTARNKIQSTRWTSTATVVAAEPGRRFAFAVGAVERPTAVWTFDLAADDSSVVGTGTTVQYTVVLGRGPSMFDMLRHLDDEQYDAVVDRRLDGFSASMARLLDALGTAESAATWAAPSPTRGRPPPSEADRPRRTRSA